MSIILDEADELDIAMLCLEENIEDEVESIENNIVEDEIEDKIGEELDSIYIDSNEIEPDDSDVTLVGMDAEEELDADVDMVGDEEEEMIDLIENEDI